MNCLRCSLLRLYQRKALTQYQLIIRRLFNKNLLLTNVGISISLSAFGDVIQQNYEKQFAEREWDKKRTYHMSVSGLTVGILCHYTYHYLDVLFPGRSLKNVFKKVLVDQIVCSPLCIALFFVTLSCLEGFDTKKLRDEIVQKSWRLYFAEWMVWPPAQVVNFYVVPLKYRVLYDNTISLGFDIYTSYVKHEIPLEE